MSPIIHRKFQVLGGENVEEKPDRICLMRSGIERLFGLSATFLCEFCIVPQTKEGINIYFLEIHLDKNQSHLAEQD